MSAHAVAVQRPIAEHAHALLQCIARHLGVLGEELRGVQLAVAGDAEYGAIWP